jgi:hypothetical protein
MCSKSMSKGLVTRYAGERDQQTNDAKENEHRSLLTKWATW